MSFIYTKVVLSWQRDFDDPREGALQTELNASDADQQHPAILALAEFIKKKNQYATLGLEGPQMTFPF